MTLHDNNISLYTIRYGMLFEYM